MSILYPFQDLNHQPQPLPLPTIEPKVEPLDGQHLQLLQPPVEPNPNPPILQTHSPPVPQIIQQDQNGDVNDEYLRVSEAFRSALRRKRGGLEVLPQDLAIVPHPQAQNGATELVSKAPVARRAQRVRSGQMVRVTDLSQEQYVSNRKSVRSVRMLYESLRLYLLQEQEESPEPEPGRRFRADLKAGSTLNHMGLWLNKDQRIIGHIPGVSIGDVFLYRMELCVVGLHGQGQAGIDFVAGSQSPTGEPVATSIILSGGYEDDEDVGDEIIYTGQGGQARNSVRQCVDQKLEGGNLALERSMFYGIEVRVIRKVKCDTTPRGKAYVYDGLYNVVNYWFQPGKSGFSVYKYRLVRMPDQQQMGSSIFEFAAGLRTRPLILRPAGYLSFDLSLRKEKLPVYLYNDFDTAQDPLYYAYLVRPIYPTLILSQTNIGGCGCKSDCLNGCYCAQKNGGEFPYGQNGILLRGKPLIYECGAFCQCPPTCRNRVSQNGMKYRLEIFRSEETSWGVRPLCLIPAGSFICEYTGVVLTPQQASILAMNGNTFVDPKRFPERWAEWGDLSKVFPDFIRPTIPPAPFLDFVLDVSRMRNVACYFSHSSNPNVLVQFVMYGHHPNVLYPRLMLFAMENIPPLTELSLDYGSADQGTELLAICN